MADYKDIAGRIRTTAADGVSVEAQEIKDLLLDKSQQEVNADVQQGLSDRYTKEETYNRDEIEELVDPTNYVSVVATNQTTAVTDLLPETGAADTIYRIGNWDGTQYDPTVYALYSWNGTAYACLAVRSFVGEIYDISANHPDGQGNPTVYSDLDAALGSGGANIPADIRQGGMTVKFIQNVPNGDNKYVQYRLKAQSFTTDVTQWAVDDGGVYVDNPEFKRVYTDKDDRILWAIKADGSIYYGAGVPPQIIDYIQQKIDELSLDEYEDIVAFLNGLEEGEALQTLLDKKVDKEEGKSLINTEYAAGVSHIENTEWAYVVTDTNHKIIAGIKTDGSIEWSVGVPAPVKDYVNTAIAKIIAGTESTDIDGVAKIIDFLSDFSTTDTLKNLLDTKVDKAEGKSLINSDFADNTFYVENAEYIDVRYDANKAIIWAIKKDGTIYYGAGVPQQIVDYINNKIAELSLDEYEDIVSFLSNYLGSDTTLKNLLDDINKVIPELVENNEFLQAITDNNRCFVFGIKTDGSIEWAKGVPQPIKDFVNEHISKSDVQKLQELIATYTFAEDSEGRLELKIIENDIIISYRKADGTLVELSGIETPLVKTKKVISTNAESDNTVTKNLTISENINLSESAKQYIVNALPEDIGSYKTPNLPKYGTTNLKTEVFYLTAYEGVESIDDVVCIQDFADTVENARKRMTISHYYVKSTLTDNGDGSYSINENSVRLQHYAAGKVKLNTTDNKYYAKDPVRKVSGVCYYADTLGYTGVMGSNRNVVIEGYTREAPADPELAEGAVKQTEVEVVQITGPVCVNAWTVEDWDFNASLGADIGKKYEHNCIGDVDFGHYFSGTDIAIGVKHQGNSTQIYRKRNFRYTFYKNATFAKKDKKKIGEMIRLSKFNLKANWLDDSRLKEMILYRVFTEIWQNHRPITDRYNWDGGANGYYHGSTGNIKGFPIKFSVAGDFYGIYMFTIPKDGSNYLIDDKDEDTGLFVSGAHNTNNDWGVTLPYVIEDHYDSEMDSDLEDYPGIIAALEEWTHFINNRLYEGSDNNTYNSTQLTEVDGTMYVTSTLEDGQVVPTSVSAELIEFNKENAYKRLDVLGFIDYFICMQLFIMVDNGHNNMLLYSGAEKKKIFPFFYDLDGSMPAGASYGYNCDVLSVSYSGDTSLWRNIRDIYWDDIVNRYCELRKSVLTDSYIEKVYKELADNIPASDYTQESSKWGATIKASNFDNKLTLIRQRLEYLDTNYFIV